MPFSVPVSKQRLSHLLCFLAQSTEALIFACPPFIPQLFLTACLGSSLLILQQDSYNFLFSVLKALMFFPEVRSPCFLPFQGGPGDATASNCSPALGRGSTLLSETAVLILITL